MSIFKKAFDAMTDLAAEVIAAPVTIVDALTKIPDKVDKRLDELDGEQG